jgi:hypothetical protein
MSALFQELATQGVTSEDIEKAAAARLFEKTAAAEGIDLSSMNGAQQDELFGYFVDNVLPGMVNGDDSLGAKVASLDEDVKIALFEKQAAYEGVDLEALGEADLQNAYSYFHENLLPTMVAQDGDVVKVASDDTHEKVAEAQAKLAEAEILGRHMARAYHDESMKLAGERTQGRTDGPRVFNVGPDGRHQQLNPIAVSEHRVPFGERAAQSARNAAGKVRAGVKKSPYLAAGTGVLAAGGLAYGAKKLYDRRQANKAQSSAQIKESSAPILEAMAMQKAAEILEANGIDPYTGAYKEASIDEIVDQRALEILAANGYLE